MNERILEITIFDKTVMVSEYHVDTGGTYCKWYHQYKQTEGGKVPVDVLLDIQEALKNGREIRIHNLCGHPINNLGKEGK